MTNLKGKAVAAPKSSREVRDAVLKSGMEHGVATSYDTLEEILVAMVAGGGI